jgi:predicted metal-binding transcription factor (methanogenesis marker protein 9)
LIFCLKIYKNILYKDIKMSDIENVKNELEHVVIEIEEVIVNEAIEESHVVVEESHVSVEESHTVVEESHVAVEESHAVVEESHVAVEDVHVAVEESHAVVEDVHVSLEKTRVSLMSEMLVDILVKNDDIKGFADKISIRVDSKKLEMLKSILSKSPESLDKIVKNLEDILNDGVIDHKDIPRMIILVSNLYKTDFKSVITAKKLTSEEIVSFIIFIVKLVIDLDYINVHNKVEIYEVIDASAALLEMIIPSGEINCGFLSRLFPCLKKQ